MGGTQPGRMIIRKSPEDIDNLASLGRLLASILRRLAESIRPGVTTTRDLDTLALRLLEENNVYPAFKGYRGYPDALCVAVNEQVVHGIPNDKPLLEGDIVGLDIGIVRDRYYADGAWTYPVGQVSKEAQRLMNVTREALYQGIAQAKPGNRVGDISAAVQRYVENNGYSVVRELVGHGIGFAIHEDPAVPNFGRADTGPRLEPGMTICIEPMVNMGTKDVEFLDDKWTVVTRDRKLSAHFEHMVAVTQDGPLILTVEEG
jgi:methionyl aminopeptidase